MIGIFGPAIESEMIESDFAGFVSNADRAGVAQPAAIGGNPEKINCVEICPGFVQDGSNARFGGAVFNEEINALDFGQMADNFREGPGDGRKFPGPIGELVRPAEPGGFVGFPFGRHSEAEGAWRFGLRRCFHRTKELNTESAEDTESTE